MGKVSADTGHLVPGTGPRKTNMGEVGLGEIPGRREEYLPFPEVRQERGCRSSCTFPPTFVLLKFDSSAKNRSRRTVYVLLRHWDSVLKVTKSHLGHVIQGVSTFYYNLSLHFWR